MTDTAKLGPCSPFFIVKDIPSSLDHYLGGLGFECRFQAPEEKPFFAIVGRASAQIMLKAFGEDVGPLPNHRRHEWARWDAFVYVSDPDALARELTDRQVTFRRALGDTEDGLRGFEVSDPDDYVCFFGRPR